MACRESLMAKKKQPPKHVKELAIECDSSNSEVIYIGGPQVANNDYDYKLYPGDSLTIVARNINVTELAGNEYEEMHQVVAIIGLHKVARWVTVRYGYSKDPRRSVSERDLEQYTVEIVGIQIFNAIDPPHELGPYRYFDFYINSQSYLKVLVWQIRVFYLGSTAFLEELWRPTQGRILRFHAEGNPENWSLEAQRACRSTKLLLFWLTGKSKNPPSTGRPKDSGNLSNVSIVEVKSIYAYLLAKHEYNNWPQPTLNELAGYYGVDRTTFYRWRKKQGLVSKNAIKLFKIEAVQQAKSISLEDIKAIDKNLASLKPT
jgi:hypothetical protein